MKCWHAHISSSRRASGNSSSFVFNLSIPGPFNRCAVVKAAIPRSWFLIVAPFNTFQLVEDGVAVTVTIPPGNYTLIGWMKQVAPIITASSPNGWVYIATRQSSPNRGTYNWSVFGATSQPQFIITSMSEQMCLPPGTHTFAAGALTGTIPYSSTGELGLQVCSDLTSAALSDILTEIYSVGHTAPGDVMVSELQDVKIGCMFEASAGRTSFHFYLRSPTTGQVIDLNGHDWLMQLMFWTEDMPHPIAPPPEAIATPAITKPKA